MLRPRYSAGIYCFEICTNNEKGKKRNNLIKITTTYVETFTFNEIVVPSMF